MCRTHMSDSHACCRSPSSLADYWAATAASILQLLPMSLWRLRLGKGPMSSMACIGS